MTQLLADLPSVVSVTRLPIQQASATLAEECVNAATDGMEHLFTPSLRANMIARAHPDAVEPLDLLLDDHGAAGWIGLVVYPEAEHTWETTTFLAPRLRGTGLFGWAKCWQVHAMEDLRAAHCPHLRLVTSINPNNARSLAATGAYARTHGWPDTGGFQHEPSKQRTGWVIERPTPTPHACHRSHG